jgi:tetratricopeptide (TPR) repeat protein
MKKSLLLVLLVCLAFLARAKNIGDNSGLDSNEVVKLTKRGFSMRLTDPAQTVKDADKALALAQRINYTAGIAESWRVMGIGNYYLNQSVKAIDNYLTALNLFIKLNDLNGEGKVYNNIGNLYRDNDYDRALDYFEKALAIAKKLSDNKLIAPIYLNIGNAYYSKKRYNLALNYYNKSNDLYIALKDTVNLITCMQNKGVIYLSLNEMDLAEAFLLSANQKAKELDLNDPVARIDLSLAELYMKKKQFDAAEKAIEEGVTFSNIIKNEKTLSDFKLTSYELEYKRKNYEKALNILHDIYRQDSAVYKQNTSTQINLIQEQVKQQARERENEILLQRQRYDRIRFWGVTIVLGLLLVLVGILVSNVKRKAKTNIQLTNLNSEVSRQKDNLDRINHHLEEIIDERTKDLQVKNKKLSEYSSYLSHQIRGPIATLKGLMNLEKEGLVDQHECIRMMNKCVSEIDDKIIEMSDMLHDPGRIGF